jgi:hypothetical protein
MSSDADQELEAQRLADYSDAVRRGRPDLTEGVDPLDAAIIRRLHALGSAATPSAEYLAGLPRQIASQSIFEGSGEGRDSQSIPSIGQAFNTEPAIGPDRTQSFLSSRSSGNGEFEIRPPSRFERAWSSKSAIAAGLALLIATAALIVLIAIYLDNGDQTPAAESTATVAPTSVPTSAAAITPTISLNVFSSPVARISESYLVYPKFIEPSLVGLQTPTMDSFRSVSLKITWDGQGSIMLSGCPDQACNYVLDDQLQLAVTNPEKTEAPVRISDNGTENGESRGLPILLTGLFRKGDNQLTAHLIDRRGNERGARTPIYIVILH